MATVNQPNVAPTNKLTAAIVAAAISQVAGLATRNLAPHWYDPTVWAALEPILIFAVGWLVPDRPNISVTVQP